MKRAHIGLFLFGGVVLGTIACGGTPPSTLQPASKGDDDDSNSAPVASAVASTTPPPAAAAPAVSASTSAPAPVGTVPPINTNCTTTTTALACGQCCFQQDNPLAGCACGPGSACAGPCGTNVCAGQMPNLECAACLFTAQCNISGMFSAGGSGSGLEQCMQASGCQTKALPTH